MATTQPAQRRAFAFPVESPEIQRARAEAWAEAMQAEAQDPQFLRALSDQHHPDWDVIRAIR